MPRLRLIAISLAALTIALSVGAAFLAINDLRATTIASRADRADLRVKLDQQTSATRLLAQQVEALGEEPIVTPQKPTLLPTAKLIPGPPGKDGPSLAQVVHQLIPDIGDVIRMEFAACVSSGRCVGPKGDNGANGTNGADAPRITSITCDGSTGRFTMSDGGTFTVAGMCAGSSSNPLPDPDPTPEPEPTP